MISIRTATAEDATACAEIYRPFVTDSWVSFEIDPPDNEMMAERIRTNCASHGWLIAEIKGKVVGYAYASAHRTRQAYQTSCDVAVYVEPSYARMGIGRALYVELFIHLRENGYHAAFAGIALPNPGSIRLHEEMGFTPIGVYKEVGWKLGGWRDVGWWQRLL